MPFQFDISMSSPSASPYEHASVNGCDQQLSKVSRTIESTLTSSETFLAFL